MGNNIQVGDIWTILFEERKETVERQAVVVYLGGHLHDGSGEPAEQVCRACLLLHDNKMATTWDLVLSQSSSDEGTPVIEVWNEFPVLGSVLEKKVSSLSTEDKKKLLCARRWRTFPTSYKIVENSPSHHKPVDGEFLLRSEKTGELIALSFGPEGKLRKNAVIQEARSHDKRLALLVAEHTITTAYAE